MILAKGHVSCLAVFSMGFSHETIGPISFKFHMQSTCNGEKEVYFFLSRSYELDGRHGHKW